MANKKDSSEKIDFRDIKNIKSRLDIIERNEKSFDFKLHILPSLVVGIAVLSLSILLNSALDKPNPVHINVGEGNFCPDSLRFSDYKSSEDIILRYKNGGANGQLYIELTSQDLLFKTKNENKFTDVAYSNHFFESGLETYREFDLKLNHILIDENEQILSNKIEFVIKEISYKDVFLQSLSKKTRVTKCVYVLNDMNDRSDLNFLLLDEINA